MVAQDNFQEREKKKEKNERRGVDGGDR